MTRIKEFLDWYALKGLPANRRDAAFALFHKAEADHVEQLAELVNVTVYLLKELHPNFTEFAHEEVSATYAEALVRSAPDRAWADHENSYRKPLAIAFQRGWLEPHGSTRVRWLAAGLRHAENALLCVEVEPSSEAESADAQRTTRMAEGKEALIARIVAETRECLQKWLAGYDTEKAHIEAYKAKARAADTTAEHEVVKAIPDSAGYVRVCMAKEGAPQAGFPGVPETIVRLGDPYPPAEQELVVVPDDPRPIQRRTKPRPGTPAARLYYAAMELRQLGCEEEYRALKIWCDRLRTARVAALDCRKVPVEEQPGYVWHTRNIRAEGTLVELVLEIVSYLGGPIGKARPAAAQTTVAVQGAPALTATDGHVKESAPMAAKKNDLEKWLDHSHDDLGRYRDVSNWLDPDGGSPGCFCNPSIATVVDGAIWNHRVNKLLESAGVADTDLRCAEVAVNALGMLNAAGNSTSVEPGRLQILVESLICAGLSPVVLGYELQKNRAHDLARAGMLHALRSGMLIRHCGFVTLPPGVTTLATIELSEHERWETLRGQWKAIIEQMIWNAEIMAGRLWVDPHDPKTFALEQLIRADELARHMPPPFNYGDFRGRVRCEAEKKPVQCPWITTTKDGDDGTREGGTSTGESVTVRHTRKRKLPPKTGFLLYLESCVDQLNTWQASALSAAVTAGKAGASSPAALATPTRAGVQAQAVGESAAPPVECKGNSIAFHTPTPTLAKEKLSPQSPAPPRSTKPRKKHVFLSYCHDNTNDVARLRSDLLAAGERMWWDKDILPGKRWKQMIRQAMADSYAVVVCLSSELARREQSGIYPEISDAIEIFRQFKPGSIFLIPLRMSACEVPPIEIDVTTTLQDLQRVDLFPATNRDAGFQQLLAALKATPHHP